MTRSDPRPQMDTPALAAAVVAQTFARLNARAWGIAFAFLGGLGLLMLTWVLVLRGGEVVGPHLILLRNYLPGYSVTFVGGIVGFVYGFVIGYAFGRLVGTVYNRLLPASKL